MQVLLRETIPSLGKKGDVKQVKSGFFRNFLLPQGKAMLVTAKMTQSLAKSAELQKKKMARVEQEALKVKDVLAKRSLKFHKKVTKAPKIYGSISVNDLVKAVDETFNVKITKEQVVLPEGLKTIGSHTVTIALSPSVHAPLTVIIEPAE